jgi:hypothetical protein
MGQDDCELGKFSITYFVCDEFGENGEEQSEIPKFMSKI